MCNGEGSQIAGCPGSQGGFGENAFIKTFC